MAEIEEIHVFERAGLGKAPYRFIGFEVKTYQACPGAPIQPGSSCDYCGQGIKLVCWIKGSDNWQFKVGSDCVEKTGDRGLRRLAKAHVRDYNRVMRHKREDARIERAREMLKSGEMREWLRGQEHPLQWRREQGDTRLDWAEWMLDNAGRRGAIQVAKVLEARHKELYG